MEQKFEGNSDYTNINIPINIKNDNNDVDVNHNNDNNNCYINDHSNCEYEKFTLIHVNLTVLFFRISLQYNNSFWNILFSALLCSSLFSSILFCVV